jgi:hypothetical protein
MREAVTTLPGSLGVNPPEWTTAHHNVPPEWLDQEGHPCMIGGRHGTMQVKDGRLICVVSPSVEARKFVVDPGRISLSRAQASKDTAADFAAVASKLDAKPHGHVIKYKDRTFTMTHMGKDKFWIPDKTWRGKHAFTSSQLHVELGPKAIEPHIKESVMKPLAFDVEAALRTEAKNPLADLSIHSQLAHAVTRYDRRQQSSKYHNPHALGLYLGAAERAQNDIKGGKSVVDAINTHFNGSLANHIHKTLKTGGRYKEDSNMNDDVITEATTLRFSPPVEFR